MKARMRWCAPLLLLAAGCLVIGGTRPAAEAAIEPAAGRAVRPEAEVKGDGAKTLAYWKQLGELIDKKHAVRAPEPPTAVVAASVVARRQTEEIQALPVVGVDLEALEMSASLVALSRRAPVVIESVRWYHGLGWPLPEEAALFIPQTRALRKEMERLRVVLSRRYGLDFPILNFPDV